jgi:hypothetical protein
VYQEGVVAQIKLKIEVNQGKKGIPFTKLESLIEDMRRFLTAIGEDIELVEASEWIALDFTNGSLGFVSEYPYEAAEKKLNDFNGAIVALAKSEFPPSIRKSTANAFFDIADRLENGETTSLVVFDGDGKAVPTAITKETATQARLITVLPYRRSQGAVQGKIHSLYKESKPQPFFHLRELSTGHLVKCVYKPSEYPDVVKALTPDDQVIHVRGTVFYHTRNRDIDHIDVEQIKPVEPYGFEDVEKFLHSNGA